MVSVEIYCDGCSTPAPAHRFIEGVRSGQKVREAVPDLRRWLIRNCGWIYSYGGHDLCPECSPGHTPCRSMFNGGFARGLARKVKGAEQLTPTTEE